VARFFTSGTRIRVMRLKISAYAVLCGDKRGGRLTELTFHRLANTHARRAPSLSAHDSSHADKCFLAYQVVVPFLMIIWTASRPHGRRPEFLELTFTLANYIAL